ncbi:MAG TPA: alpha/beta fold hydrolase [Pseudonocardiaceae bacterium]
MAFIPPSCCGAGYFSRLRRALGDRVDFRAVELPGHGRRYREAPLTAASAATADAAARIHDAVGTVGTGGTVDAVYGESLGAYVALAVTALLSGPGGPLLLAASNSPPSVRERIPVEDVHSVGAAIALLTAMGGRIPPELADRPEVARQALPLMRADLALSQSFIELTRTSATGGDLVVLAGTDDRALTGLDAWAAHALGRCHVVRLPGGHLLSATNPAGVADVILRSVGTG